MEQIYSIYKHTVPNGKVYIGATCQNVKSRWGVNGSNYKSNPLFYDDIQKYGWDNIKHEVLHTVFTREDAYFFEKEEIKNHNSMNPDYGYNRNPGNRLHVCKMILDKVNGVYEERKIEPMLTIDELAEELAVSKNYIYGLVLEGLPNLRIGRRTLRFERKEVIKWLKEKS